MSEVNLTSTPQTITIEKLSINNIVINLNDNTCVVTVTGYDIDNATSYLNGQLFVTNLTLSGTDFSNNINIPAIKTWVCDQLGYTQS